MERCPRRNDMKTIKRMHLRVTRDRLSEDGGPYHKQVRSSAGVSSIAADLLRGEDQEVVLAFHLDTNNRIQGYHEVARGSLNGAIVMPREVFRTAIVNGAAAVILVHNHPSGDPTPSDDDRAFTERLHKAGKLVGIALLDHVVIGDEGRSFSFLDTGLLS